MDNYDVPEARKASYYKALSGQLPPVSAIRVQCYHCMGWNIADAKRCTTKACPLWSYSPSAKAMGEYRKGHVKVIKDKK